MDDEWSIFLGFGSCHDLRDAGRPDHRFWQLRSTSKAAAAAYSRKPEPRRKPIGFHRPK